MENININTIIALACFAWVISNFQPFLYVLNLIPVFSNKYLGFISDAFKTLMKCTTCFAFWFSWIITGDLFMASIVCVVATFLSNNLTKTKL